MKIKMNGMVATYHNLHIFGSESHHVLYHLLLSFSPSHTIHIFQNFSSARSVYHLRHLSLVIIFFSGTISIMQSCVLCVVNVSLTQTIYINLLFSSLCSLTLYLLHVHSCSALFCNLSLPRLTSFYIYMYLYLYRQIFRLYSYGVSGGVQYTFRIAFYFLF